MEGSPNQTFDSDLADLEEIKKKLIFETPAPSQTISRVPSELTNQSAENDEFPEFSKDYVPVQQAPSETPTSKKKMTVKYVPARYMNYTTPSKEKVQAPSKTSQASVKKQPSNLSHQVPIKSTIKEPAVKQTVKSSSNASASTKNVPQSNSQVEDSFHKPVDGTIANISSIHNSNILNNSSINSSANSLNILNNSSIINKSSNSLNSTIGYNPSYTLSSTSSAFPKNLNATIGFANSGNQSSKNNSLSLNSTIGYPSSAVSKKTTGMTGVTGIPSKSSTSASDASSIPLEKSVEDLALELDILKAQLTQYCYVNNLSEKSLNEQQKDAEKVMYSRWIHLSKMKQDHFELQQKVEHDKFTKVLELLLSDHLSLEEIPILEFLENFEELSKALKTTMHRLPLHNVAANTTEMGETLQSSMGNLESFLSDNKEMADQLSELASTSAELSSVVDDECTELLKCRELLLTHTALQNQLMSLQIQQIQSSGE